MRFASNRLLVASAIVDGGEGNPIGNIYDCRPKTGEETHFVGAQLCRSSSADGQLCEEEASSAE